MSEQLLTTRELAKKLAVSERHIFNLLKKGLPHFKIEKCLRFDLQEVLEWLKQKTEEAEAKRG